MEDCLSIRARTGFPLKLDNSLNDIHNYSSLSVAANDPIGVGDGNMWMASEAPGLGVVVDDARLGEPDRVLAADAAAPAHR